MSEATRELVSYSTLRKVVGIFGFALPVTLVAGCYLLDAPTVWDKSISDYYGSPMRNVLVGILFTVAWFLFTYRGYDKWDNRLGDGACFAALAVALFPITSEHAWVQYVHLLAAGTLFVILAIFALARFTLTDPNKQMTPRKQQRNVLYRVCGGIILACIVGMGVYMKFFQDSALAPYHPVFWLETVALFAFATSWCVKGEMALTD